MIRHSKNGIFVTTCEKSVSPVVAFQAYCLYLYLKYFPVYSEPCQISKMFFFSKKNNGWSYFLLYYFH